ncbi:hypothetical protein [Paraburkholderia sp. 40]|uniref:hypothetical protein n=1 Tax=Paraburkholderia sp. 40 TaxID=2991059 RepID=UPI003D23DF8B
MKSVAIAMLSGLFGLFIAKVLIEQVFGPDPVLLRTIGIVWVLAMVGVIRALKWRA